MIVISKFLYEIKLVEE